ncbi:MAG TPA: alpha/beta hydrolase [bacterium]|nr:alpha/beta hydrolase [bacterium]
MFKKEIIVDNLKINYYQSPELKTDGTLVFLPGWQAKALIFKNLFELTDNFIALDWPGFGESERPGSVWGLAEYAEFLKKFLKKLEIDNPILVGHSFGGSVIIKYSALGGQARKIILIDSAGIRRKNLKKSFYFVGAKIVKVFLWLPVISKYKQATRKKFYQSIDAVDYMEAGEMRAIYQKVISEDLTGDLQKVKVKTVLIWGEKDKATPVEDGRLMNNQISDSELFIIKDAGHFPFLEKEEEFKKIFAAQI